MTERVRGLNGRVVHRGMLVGEILLSRMITSCGIRFDRWVSMTDSEPVTCQRCQMK